MPPKVSKYCSFNTSQLELLLADMIHRDSRPLKSREYMISAMKHNSERREANLVQSEYIRRLHECERMRKQFDRKLISRNDMAPDRCLHEDIADNVSFKKSKQTTKRCTSPATKKTVLDPLKRYHKSAFLDPFGVLGLPNAPPASGVTETDNPDADVKTVAYRRTYADANLQAVADSTTVKEMIRAADVVIFKTTAGCKG